MLQQCPCSNCSLTCLTLSFNTVCVYVCTVCMCLSPPPPPPSCLTPTVLTQKCQFCNFHAVFGHFAQITPPPLPPTTSRPHPLGNPAFLLTLTTLTFQPIIVIWVKKDKIDKSFFSNFKNFSITVATAPIWLFA